MTSEVSRTGPMMSRMKRDSGGSLEMNFLFDLFFFKRHHGVVDIICLLAWFPRTSPATFVILWTTWSSSSKPRWRLNAMYGEGI